jgi:uncharacterized protein YbaP (TraB family)
MSKLNLQAGVFWGLALAAALWAGPAPAAGACPPPLPSPSANGPARDRGLLWRLTRDGRSSWLFGTLHVGKPAWSRLGPRTTAALQASDVLAVEIDPADPALLQALTETGPPPVLPADLQARLTKAFERACISPASLASLHPLLQATTLTVLEARWLGLDAAYAQENLLLDHSRNGGRRDPQAEGPAPASAHRLRVLALETPAQQKSALLPGDPAEVLSTLSQSLSQLEDPSGRRVLARLARAWERGDLHALSTYEQWCACATTDEERAFMRRLNDERNPALADGIEAQHRAGQRVFAGVGALHMTGPAALPVLMARRGFRVERIVFAP